MLVKDMVVFQNPLVVFCNPVTGQNLSSRPDSLGRAQSVRQSVRDSSEPPALAVVTPGKTS